MMRKGKGFRAPRRRGFDDDGPSEQEFRPSHSPRPAFASAPSRDMSAAAQGPVVDATVKWFNPEKGFGFAELADGSGDVFMHVATLQQSGHDTVSPGAKLKVKVGNGAKGRQVMAVLEVDESTASASAPPRPAGGGARPTRHAPDYSAAVEMEGTVKWFNGDKGFGFISSSDGGKDIFVHVSVLGNAGLVSLAEGQQVSMRVVDTPKGREAVSLTLIG